VDIVNVGLLGLSRSLGGAHLFLDHRSCSLRYLTLRVCFRGTRMISVILDSLR
jgi:hypothetical protein